VAAETAAALPAPGGAGRRTGSVTVACWGAVGEAFLAAGDDNEVGVDAAIAALRPACCGVLEEGEIEDVACPPVWFDCILHG